jgi:uncharacterized membrane protein affecting hemolysin expression
VQAIDIVELVVLTGDTPFLQTLREAVGDTRRVWHVATADKVGELLVAGEVGILVVDAQALTVPVAEWIAGIKRQLRDLVIVCAGTREIETAFAEAISVGVVYRFIHKPMSPARAKLFVDAAVHKHADLRARRKAIPATAPTVPIRRGLLALAALGVAVVLVTAGWAFWVRSAGPGASLAADSGDAKDDASSPLLMRAAAALAADHLTEPAGNNALEFYLRELGRNPRSAVAHAGIAEIRERLCARAQSALLEERLDVAALAIATARRAGVESGRIALLTAQLTKARERSARRAASDAAP